MLANPDRAEELRQLHEVAPIQTALEIDAEPRQAHSPAVREYLDRLKAACVPKRASDGYWFPVARRGELGAGGLIHLRAEFGRSQHELAKEFPDFALAPIDTALAAAGYSLHLQPAPQTLAKLKFDGASCSLAAVVAALRRREGHLGTGHVVLTGRVKLRGGALEDAVVEPVSSCATKLRVLETELAGTHFFACSDDPAALTSRTVQVHNLEEGTSIRAVLERVRQIEDAHEQQDDFDKAFSSSGDGTCLATNVPVRNERVPERSFLVRIGTTVRLPRRSFEGGGVIPGWNRQQPRAAMGWLSKLNAHSLEAHSSGTFLQLDGAPAVYELNPGHLSRARVRGSPGAGARFIGADLVPKGLAPPGCADLLDCDLGIVLHGEPCELADLLKLNSLRNQLWNLELEVDEARRGGPGKSGPRITLSGLVEELRLATTDGRMPGLPGLATPAEQLARGPSLALTRLFQVAHVDFREVSTPERIRAWTLFASASPEDPHDGTAPVLHWPTANTQPHQPPGALYGLHDKAVSFLLDADDTFTLEQKSGVIMTSNYTHWLLASRRLQLGLAPLTAGQLAGIFSETLHRGYVAWLEQVLRSG